MRGDPPRRVSGHRRRRGGSISNNKRCRSISENYIQLNIHIHNVFTFFASVQYAPSAVEYCVFRFYKYGGNTDETEEGRAQWPGFMIKIGCLLLESNNDGYKNALIKSN